LTEAVFGGCREPLAHELGSRRQAQGCRPKDGNDWVGDDLSEQCRVLARLRVAEAGDKSQLEPLQARQEVGEPTKRRRVAPVEVVDREQQRPVGGGVGREPIEAVHHRQGQVGRRLGDELGGIEEWSSELRRAR
jgi:hypothetical protein